jgi:hypothetical protein
MMKKQEKASYMTFLHSIKIEQWFNNNGHLDGFWDWVFNHEIADSQEQDGEYREDHVERAFLLGRKAKDKPVYVWHSDTDQSCLYFIGEEDAVLARLQNELDAWLKKYPQGNEAEKKASKLRKQIEAAEQEMNIKEMHVDFLKNELLKLGIPDEALESFHTHFHFATNAKNEGVVKMHLKNALAAGAKTPAMMSEYVDLVTTFLSRLKITNFNHTIKIEDLIEHPPTKKVT